MEGEDQLVEEGLGLADAAGLTETANLDHFSFVESFWNYFQSDLISSIPITICSFLLVAVLIERSMFYAKNNRDISIFIHNLQSQLEKGNLEAAQMLSSQLGSVIGEVAEEGVRLLAVQREDFSRAYDITTSIVTRKLQKYLPILATIGAIAPFLGLFGTVSGVIKALFRMSMGSEGASLKMIGEISNALIATGYGLFIAIIAVVSYNLFSNIVKRYNDDFMLLKLLFLSFSNIDFDISRSFVNSRDDSKTGTQEYYTQAPQQVYQTPSTSDILNNTRKAQEIQANEKPSYPDFLK
ncbi:MAG: biopolymer transport protein TolQ [Cyanobacteriota bacterium]|jgi:biopolymer transport protein ExbB